MKYFLSRTIFCSTDLFLRFPLYSNSDLGAVCFGVFLSLPSIKEITNPLLSAPEASLHQLTGLNSSLVWTAVTKVPDYLMQETFPRWQLYLIYHLLTLTPLSQKMLQSPPLVSAAPWQEDFQWLALISPYTTLCLEETSWKGCCPATITGFRMRMCSNSWQLFKLPTFWRSMLNSDRMSQGVLGTWTCLATKKEKPLFSADQKATKTLSL